MAKILTAVSIPICLLAHAFSLCLLWARLEVANGIISALLLLFGMAAAKAFYVLRCSARAEAFDSVPKLRLPAYAGSAPTVAALLFAIAVAFLTLRGIATSSIGRIPLGSTTLLLALLYLSLLLAAFSERKH